ncbi:RidA family protein [Enterovibrio nigricans]|uniref:Enamine deaminase RidA, house cleaning of reactive enamine intermediates, YjgF/YER057c/UK114 family n=1 Tax=Enterovibrio nigricans DSM 22720 TaxID=1121868 RepID=A0A1T4UZU8_9GAMM|nr:RidA family protein [Enterovibrio nigricans]PKF50199.1 RidA family protein [Enterovibrio nigricans]SKA58229.1 Enamine deaminase RidA, house cleaning of reactive enamine intermediates, YjgF/YER057c/UK114 family [Enterovibrio nigricans DSM 22720]
MTNTVANNDAEAQLIALGLQLPKVSNAQGNYANCVRTGNLLYVSGKGPVAGLDVVPKGKLGREYSVDEGYEFAKATGLDILAAVKLELGSLDNIARVVKIQGFVNATEDFEQHPKVLDGCSDLFATVLGERGVHARSVFGALSLRGNLPIIIDSIFEVKA